MRMAQERVLWVSEANWRLVDHRTSLRHRHPVDQRELHTEMRRFQASLQEDSVWMVSTTVTDIESLISAGQTR